LTCHIICAAGAAAKPPDRHDPAWMVHVQSLLLADEVPHMFATRGIVLASVSGNEARRLSAAGPTEWLVCPSRHTWGTLRFFATPAADTARYPGGAELWPPMGYRRIVDRQADRAGGRAFRWAPKLHLAWVPPGFQLSGAASNASRISSPGAASSGASTESSVSVAPCRSAIAATSDRPRPFPGVVRERSSR